MIRLPFPDVKTHLICFQFSPKTVPLTVGLQLRRGTVETVNDRIPSLPVRRGGIFTAMREFHFTERHVGLVERPNYKRGDVALVGFTAGECPH